MVTTLQIGSTTVDVVQKDIKNVHLSVYPPTGKVRISAPLRMDVEKIRLFALSKLGWIREQQRKVVEQDREPPRELIDRESHYVWGKRYLLKVVEADAPPTVELRHRTMVLRVRAGTGLDGRQTVVDGWYRGLVRAASRPLIEKWEPLMGVSVQRFFVQRMKTKWGSCSRSNRSIRLNTELAKKPPECLEYIVVHEMAHLLEPTHNSRFIALMDSLMPNWRFHREMLNRLPVRHERWEY